MGLDRTFREGSILETTRSGSREPNFLAAAAAHPAVRRYDIHNAKSLLEKNQDRIHWGALSDNTSAITLLEKIKIK